jgi:hypothetical protein
VVEVGHPEAVVACELRSHGGKTEVLRLKRESDFFAGAEQIVALIAQDDKLGSGIVGIIAQDDSGGRCAVRMTADGAERSG